MTIYSTSTYRLPVQTTTDLHRLAAELGYTRTRGRGSLYGVGNASALLRALTEAYGRDRAGFLADLRAAGVGCDPEGKPL